MNEQQHVGSRMASSGSGFGIPVAAQSGQAFCAMCLSGSMGWMPWAVIYQTAYEAAVDLAGDMARRQLWMRRLEPGVN